MLRSSTSWNAHFATVSFIATVVVGAHTRRCA